MSTEGIVSLFEKAAYDAAFAMRFAAAVGAQEGPAVFECAAAFARRHGFDVSAEEARAASRTLSELINSERTTGMKGDLKCPWRQ